MGKDRQIGNVKRGRIVGAASRRNLTSDVEIPVNVEQLLLRAARDVDFRERLLASPCEVLDSYEPALRPSERSVIESMPAHVLTTIIDRLAPPRRRQQRNSAFASAVATAVAGTMAFTVSSCASDGMEPEDSGLRGTAVENDFVYDDDYDVDAFVGEESDSLSPNEIPEEEPAEDWGDQNPE